VSVGPSGQRDRSGTAPHDQGHPAPSCLSWGTALAHVTAPERASRSPFRPWQGGGRGMLTSLLPAVFPQAVRVGGWRIGWDSVAALLTSAGGSNAGSNRLDRHLERSARPRRGLPGQLIAQVEADRAPVLDRWLRGLAARSGAPTATTGSPWSAHAAAASGRPARSRSRVRSCAVSARPRSAPSSIVGGRQDLPVGGQQRLPAHGHLVTQRAGSGRHDTSPEPSSTETLWAGAGT
jgi:hypothetical protein